MPKVWVLFTNNLRVRDNTVLNAACKSGNQVLPMYFHNTREAKAETYSMRKIWPFRAKFLCESLENLSANLKKLGARLAIIKWENISKLADYIISRKLTKVYMQEAVWIDEYNELQELKNILKKHYISLYTIWDHTLVYPDDMPFTISDLPQVFTVFRKWVEKHSQILEPLEVPHHRDFIHLDDDESLSLNDFWYSDVMTDNRWVLEFRWGEDEAWVRLQHYFWETQSLSTYKETRNGLIWADYSSKFSAWLSCWCISARSIYAEVKKYEKCIKKNSSTYWLVFELLWRDFFQFVFLQDRMRFFRDFTSESEVLNSESNRRKFEKWKDGRLWVTFVDANMRELALTGFMSNRGRQNVASYLVNDLKLDWRLGATYFERQLVDYDVASNWGNWAYVAWVGNDPQENRYFNIERQQSMYDKDCEYRKLWAD